MNAQFTLFTLIYFNFFSRFEYLVEFILFQSKLSELVTNLNCILKLKSIQRIGLLEIQK